MWDVDLTETALPQPRLLPSAEDPTVLMVPAYTDFKLHDITDPADPEAKEPVAPDRKFLTHRLWGIANQPAHFHHGLFTTMREHERRGMSRSEAEFAARRAFGGVDQVKRRTAIDTAFRRSKSHCRTSGTR